MMIGSMRLRGEFHYNKLDIYYFKYTYIQAHYHILGYAKGESQVVKKLRKSSQRSAVCRYFKETRFVHSEGDNALHVQKLIVQEAKLC